jgi:hypothetical protein
MLRVKKRFKKFRTDDINEMNEYECLLNNPLCSIIEKATEKEKEQEYNDRGNLVRQQDILYYLVHWEERLV